MRKLLELIPLALSLVAGAIFVGGFVMLLWTEIANELKARTRLDELNEKRRKARRTGPLPPSRPQ